jgi:DNA-binding transcriptional regulator YiaG
LDEHVTHVEFRAALARLGYSQTSFAELVKVGDRTVRRWAAGTQEIPGWVPLLLSLLAERPSVAA